MWTIGSVNLDTRNWILGALDSGGLTRILMDEVIQVLKAWSSIEFQVVDLRIDFASCYEAGEE